MSTVNIGKCLLCRDLPREAQEVTCCPTLYCKKCIEYIKNRKCLNCKNIGFEFYPSKSMQKLIEEERKKLEAMSSSQGMIELNVMSLKDENRAFMVNPEMKVLELRKIVAYEFGMRLESVRLMFRSKVLMDTNTLAFYNVQNKNKIHVLIGFNGGLKC
jgi:Ubiquitin family